MPREENRGGIVADPVIVGVDGSPGSRLAAQHAAETAQRSATPLILIHGYLHPFRYGVPIDPYAIQL
ncbi:MAG TPA: universal stress protein, partial [Micromonospora sp.]|nr:universal stress protein [Micromonospora sp.]